MVWSSPSVRSSKLRTYKILQWRMSKGGIKKDLGLDKKKGATLEGIYTRKTEAEKVVRKYQLAEKRREKRLIKMGKIRKSSF